MISSGVLQHLRSTLLPTVFNIGIQRLYLGMRHLRYVLLSWFPAAFVLYPHSLIIGAAPEESARVWNTRTKLATRLSCRRPTPTQLPRIAALDELLTILSVLSWPGKHIATGQCVTVTA